MARKVLCTFQKNKTTKTAKRNFSISTFNALFASAGLQINMNSTTLDMLVSFFTSSCFYEEFVLACNVRTRLVDLLDLFLAAEWDYGTLIFIINC